MTDRWSERYLVLRFILVGGMNTALAYATFALFYYLGASIELANALSLLLGIGISFVTQGALVFRALSGPAFLRYVAGWILIYFVNLGELRVFMALGANAYGAAALALVPTTVISFFIQRWLVFRPSRVA